MILFGPTVLYNHLQTGGNVVNNWSEAPVTKPWENPLAHTTQTTTVETAKADIVKGQEIFIFYGQDWFATRELNLSAPIYREYDAGQQEWERICLTDVYVASSLIPDAGNGLFGKKPYQVEERIYVSPVLTIPTALIEDYSDSTLLLNYCIATPNSPIALLMLGTSSLINHSNTPNAEIHWFDWHTTRNGEDVPIDTIGHGSIQMSLEDLLDFTFAPLDVAIIALRYIAPGEEITIDYGLSWDKAWIAHRQALSYPDVQGTPFRHAIQPPPGLFPDHWISEDSEL